jgi:hypothetical protein
VRLAPGVVGPLRVEVARAQRGEGIRDDLDACGTSRHYAAIVATRSR